MGVAYRRHYVDCNVFEIHLTIAEAGRGAQNKRADQTHPHSDLWRAVISDYVVFAIFKMERSQQPFSTYTTEIDQKAMRLVEQV